MTDNSFIQQLILSLRKVLPETGKNIVLHEPCFNGNEWKYVKDCIDTGWVSSVGKYVDQFERMLEETTGVKRAVAVVNGTAALQVSLKLAGVQRDDEILSPTLTFIATNNAIVYCGAIPHLVDSEEKSLGVCPQKLRPYLEEIADIRNDGCFNKKTGRRIKALIAMHVFGHPVDVEALLEICQKYKLEFIEDAAESLGSFYKGRHTGNWGRLSALSFNGNKTITTGGGGAILTNDPDLGAHAKHITTTARVPHNWKFIHDAVGYNFRLPNINAALGCAQLEQLPDFLKQKRALAQEYQRVFSGVKGVSFLVEPSYAKSNYWLNTLLLQPDYVLIRDLILENTNNEGIMTRPVWTLMSKLSMFTNCPRMGDLSVAEGLEKRTINIPSSPILGKKYV